MKKERRQKGADKRQKLADSRKHLAGMRLINIEFAIAFNFNLNKIYVHCILIFFVCITSIIMQ